MPLYEFISLQDDGATRLIFFESKDTPSIGTVISGADGQQWRRVASLPGTANDMQIDPFSKKDFVSKTGNKKGTLGDLWDKSKELSAARKKKLGHDPVEKKFHADYQEKFKQKHFDQRREEANKKLEKIGVSIEPR